MAIVALLPAGSRPFIDGSPDNNIFNLIFGYNGLSRLFGSGGGAGGGGGGANFSGAVRHAAAVQRPDGRPGVVAAAGRRWSRSSPGSGRRAARRAPTARAPRCSSWGGWLLVTAAVFSYSQGIIHTYYAVALAPAIAALVAIGGARLWPRRASLRRARRSPRPSVGAHRRLVVRRCSTARRAGSRGCASVVLAATAVAVAGLLLGRARAGSPAARRSSRSPRPRSPASPGPPPTRSQTIATAHTGSIPSAGPTPTAGAAGVGGPGGRRLRRGRRRAATRRGSAGGAPSRRAAPRRGGRPRASGRARPRAAAPIGGGAGGGAPAAARASVASALVTALERDAAAYRWVAATDGSTSAATYELATGGDPVMAIGGFNNNGGELSLAQFIRYVRAGDIHYYIASAAPAAARPAARRGTSAISELGRSRTTARRRSAA